MKSIIFDMDGVIFDTEKISTVIWRETAESMGLLNVEEAIVQSIGRNRKDIILLFYSLYGTDFPAEEFLHKVVKQYDELIENEGLPIMKGAVSILQFLNNNNFLVGLASSSQRKVILNHLHKTHLTPYFAKIIGGDQVEHGKPHPEIYRKACTELGVLPEKTMAIEDSPNGIRSAFAAGLRPVMIPDMLQPDEELKKLLYGQFASLAELEAAIRRGLYD